ncbi:MAG: outer membrane protein assembly factor BamC [Flavobacteriales bacterium]|jgi:outer membrane protein assembly factor BamC
MPYMNYFNWSRLAVTVLISVTIMSLAACSSKKNDDDGMFRNFSREHLKAGSIKKIDIPEELDSKAFDPLYPIPIVNVTDEFGDLVDLSEFRVPRPAGISSDEDAFGVKIQKLSDERWIFVSASTSQVWPRTQSFLALSDVDVARADAEQGVIETDWVQFKDEADKKLRFRISLEKGLHPETTEIHIREVEFALDTEVPSPFIWPKQSVNDTREEWMVGKLSEHLAETIDNASASLLGQNVGGPLKADFVDNAVEPTLRVNLSASRAWATISYASRQENFVQWEKNRTQGIIFSNYSEDFTQKRGFFGFLKFWRSYKSRDDKAPYDLAEVTKHLSSSAHSRQVFDGLDGVEFGAALKDTEGYLIIMQHNGEYADIIVRDQRGRLLPRDQAKAMIRALRKNLI